MHDGLTLPYTIEHLVELIESNHFCVLATQGRRGPHVAGVSYFASRFDIYMASGEKTAKVRNLRRKPNVAVHISIPWPVFYGYRPPPRSIQFRGIGEILPFDNSDARAALKKGPFVLRRVIRHLAQSSNTELFGDNVWIHVRPTGRINTFMVGVPITALFRDETKALQNFDFNEASL